MVVQDLSGIFKLIFIFLHHVSVSSCAWFSLTASLELFICIQINYLITHKCPAASPHPLVSSEPVIILIIYFHLEHSCLTPALRGHP